MAVFLAIPLLGLLVILQSAILSQVRLLNGTVDLVSPGRFRNVLKLPGIGR